MVPAEPSIYLAKTVIFQNKIINAAGVRPRPSEVFPILI